MKKLNYFLIGIFTAFIVFACDEDIYEIYLPLQQGGDTTIINNNITIICDTTVSSDGKVRVLSTETDLPTESCRFGEIRFQVFRGDEIIFDETRCKDSVPPGEEPCNPIWFYEDNAEGCDTFFVYDCDGNLELAQPICPEIIVEPGDTTIQNTHHADFFYDFNTGSSPDYVAVGFENHNASESDFTNRYFFGGGDSAWTKYPVYKDINSNTDTISVLWGSSLPYFIEVIEESNTGAEKVLYGKIVGGTSGFDVYNNSAYESFNYSFPKGDYTGRRFVVKVRKINGVAYGVSRNEQFNITSIYVGYSWIE